jgi:putative FmdB family regulatory protein
MPTYLYECPIHGEFEHQHSVTEELESCPICQVEKREPQKVKRLIAGGTGFMLLGGGWAKEGYK